MHESRDRVSYRAVLGLLLLSLVATTALAGEGRPAWDGDRSGLIPVAQVERWQSPRIDRAQLLREDATNEGRLDIPQRVGFPMEVDITPSNSGTWEELPNGDQVWRLKVVSDDAAWIVLGFDQFRLQYGAAMSVSTPDGSKVMGPYTARHIRKHGELWFPPIPGDTLLVELHWPARLAGETPALHLGTVSHGYKSWGSIQVLDALGQSDGDNGTDGFGDSGSCNIDTACPEAADWQDQTRGVVMVLAGGSGNCSGSMINTTAGDCAPVMLTAAHCGENGPSTTLGFNFVRPGCGVGTPLPETTYTLTGGTLLGNYASSDFTLIEMDESPPEDWAVFFNGWSRDPTPAQFTHVISHPRGDVKKIAFDADPPVNGSNWGPNHWRIDDSNPDPAHLAYEWGTTEPASSGSPLFDHDKRIIGQLHGGTASCTSDTYDEYGKLDASWVGGGTPASRASDWLDPNGTGALFVDGVDHSICLYQPAGIVLFTRDLYSCSDTLAISLRDDNIPGSPTSVDVLVSSATEATPETVTLNQIEPAVGRYVGMIPTSTVAPVHGDGQLSVSHGDILTVNYVDADDGNGMTNVTVKDNADVDCAGPAITNVQSSEVTGNSALVTWATDEPADSAVTHGLTPPGGIVDTDSKLVVEHSLRLRSLEECSIHYYSVASTDVVGNGASDDNFGASYTLETGRNVNPQYVSTDTPIPIVDNSTQLSTISVPDDKLVVDVQVGFDITHTYTGDIDATLIAPDGTRVLLVNDAGGGGDNFTGTVFDDSATTPIASGTAPFTGTFQPAQPLAGATGISSLGDWRLEIVDDAGGDTGTLDSWTLTLLFAAQACGPDASYKSHGLEADVCSTGGGDANGFWESGEQISFSLAVENSGTDGLTGVTTVVTPLTPGVVMLDGVADVGDVAEGATGTTQAPHVVAQLPGGLACGGDLQFEVQIDSNEGSWTETFNQQVGEVVPGGGTQFFEDFEAGIPVSWTIVDGGSSADTWYADDATDPAGCANTDPAPPVAGTWAAVDSDCAGSGVTVDEELITPTIDLSGTLTVALEFDHWFRANQTENADVDVRSSLTGGAWVTVGQWQTTSSPNPEHVVIDISAQAVGATDLQVRWHYYNADFEWTWFVDNVAVNYTAPGACNQAECFAGPAGPPPVADGSLGTQPLLVDRLAVDGSQISVGWDAGCASDSTNLIYGPLSQVSTYTTSGSLCGISGPHVWDPVPAGDLWFLLVNADVSGAESSWGVGALGERNGPTSSGTCGTSTKDVSGVCP